MQLHRSKLMGYAYRIAPTGLLLVATLLVAPASVFGQYESKEPESMGRYGVSAAKRYARSPTGSAEDRNQFGKFIRDNYIASMTQYDAASLADLGKNRYDFMRNFLWGAAPEVRRDVTQLAFNEMSAIVKDRYHPAVQYNAMLILGQLDATYSDRDGAPPKPLPTANKILTEYVSRGIETTKAPPHLIVGALIGLERHAKVLDQLPAANRAATASALLAVLEKDDFPHEIASSVKQWMRVIAARGLSGVGALGQGNRVHEAMMAVIGDEAMRLNNRVRVAELLEKYEAAYQSATGINERSTVQTLLQLASDIAADEKERAAEYEEDALSGRGGDSRYDFGNSRDSDLVPPEPYQVRRVLLRLSGLKSGITAVRPAVKDANLGGLLDKVVAAIDPVVNTAKSRDVILLNLTRDVKQMADAIANVSASLGVEAVEAPPESDEEAEEELLEVEAVEASAPEA